MKRIKRRMAGIILIVMLLTILLSPGSFSAWADKTDDAADDEFDISAIIDNGDDVIVVPAEDSADPIVPDENITDEESPYKVGDIITFGKYEQDGDIENGKEDIEWQVLKAESSRVLVASKYALDCQPYNTEHVDVAWETCSLRSWLNNDFLHAAFSEEEQGHIPEVTLANEDNSYYGTEGGNETTDRVFLLSVDEVRDIIGYSWYDDETLLGYGQSLVVEPTQHAIDAGAIAYSILESNYDRFLKEKGYDSNVIGCNGIGWWLRTPGFDSGEVCVVSSFGGAGADKNYSVIYGCIAVRPAMYLDINAILPAEAEEYEDPLALPEDELEDISIPEEETVDVDTDDEKDEEDGIEDKDDSKETIEEDANIDSEDRKTEEEESEDKESEDNSGEDNSEDAKPEEGESKEIVADSPGSETDSE